MNILLDDNFNLKVVSDKKFNSHLQFKIQIDFGEAKKVSDNEQDDSDSDSMSSDSSEEEDLGLLNMGQLRRGTFVGTLNYLSPEMAQNAISTLESDLWALGCIIFKMVTGRPAFPGMDLFQLKPAIVNRRVDWREDEIDPQCKDLIDKLLQVKPEDRLGAPGEKNNMNMLKAHPFFKGIDFNSDLTKLNVNGILNNTNLGEEFLTKVRPKKQSLAKEENPFSVNLETFESD